MTFAKKNHDQNSRLGDCTAIIMAGGKSRRMGTDKTLLPMGQTTLIEYVLEQLDPLFDEILISSNDANRFRNLNHDVIGDKTPGKGPIMGLITCIQAAHHDTCFVQACDIPQTDVSLLTKMLSLVSDYDAVVPRTHDGHYEPLFAVYRKSAVQAMKRILEHERGRCSLIPHRCNSIAVELTETQRLRNLNTPSDYTRFLQVIRADD